MHPSSSRAFQRDQERDLKLAGLMDLISTNKTKQNKQTTSFIDRYHGYISQKQFFDVREPRSEWEEGWLVTHSYGFFVP